MKTKSPTAKLRFVSRGHRRKPGSGLTYRAVNGPYSVYCGDQVEGVKIKAVRWLAILKTETSERIISRHRCRKEAEKSCQQHFRTTNP